MKKYVTKYSIDEEQEKELKSLMSELVNEKLEEIKDILNEWWTSEHIPSEVTQVRVLLLYKTGDTSHVSRGQGSCACLCGPLP